MKRTCLLFVAIAVSFLFFSCQSIRIIDIETYNPSAITFPQEVKTVMIVNNSAQQPDAIGHRYLSDSKRDSVMTIPADSMAYYFCMSLGKAMVESPRFYDVRICEDTLRRDSLFYDIKPFTLNEAEYFCDDYGVDALISLDKLFFTTVFSEYTMSNFAVADKTISVQISGELRALWPGQKEVYAIPFVDSLYWNFEKNIFYNDVLGFFFEPDVRFAMLYLSDITAQKMQVNFIPFWSEDRRWYYSSITSEWRRGSAFAAAEKWKEAAKVWEPLYEKTKKLKQKARLASNIALCNEMTGDFKKAIEYAELSYGFFKEYGDDNNPYTQIQNNYIDVLKKRMESDKVLSKQLYSSE